MIFEIAHEEEVNFLTSFTMEGIKNIMINTFKVSVHVSDIHIPHHSLLPPTDNVDVHAPPPAPVHVDPGVVTEDIHLARLQVHLQPQRHLSTELLLGAVIERHQVPGLQHIAGDEGHPVLPELGPQLLQGGLASCGVQVREAHLARRTGTTYWFS